jgi:hypothetical protein
MFSRHKESERALPCPTALTARDVVNAANPVAD